MGDFLATLRDVNLTGLADGSSIYWDATAKQWKTAGASYTPAFYDNAGVPTLFSSGNLTGRYAKTGLVVNGVATVICGTGGFTSGNIYVDLPIAVGTAGQIVGTWALITAGTPTAGGFVVNGAAGTTKATLVTTTFASYTGTPTAGSTLSVNFNYLANA